MLTHNAHIVHTSMFEERLLLPLKKEGFLSKLLSKHPLKNFDLTNPQCYVPQELLYDFTLKIDRYLGPSGFCTLISDYRKSYAIDELGDYGSHVISTPNMLTALQEAVKHVKIIGTNISHELRIFGNRASFSFQCIDPPKVGKELWEAVLFSLVIESLKSFCGPNWAPLGIQIPNKTANDIEKILPQGDYHVSWGHQHYALIFPVELLSLPTPTPPRPAREFQMEESVEKLAYRTEKLLFSNQQGRRARMTDFSDYFNLSTRTIRRQLLSEGTSFSEIHDRVIFLRALNLLSNPKWEINEISEHLGYSEPSHFIRFFKQRTGVTPGKFREIPS